MKNILTLYSSARPDGNTFQMVRSFNQLMPGEMLYLDDLDINEYDYQYRHQDDDFESTIDRMLWADIVIFACPVYWYSLTPAFKRFFDRFTDLTDLPGLKVKGKALREKEFYLFSTSVHPEPPAAFISVVRDTLRYLGWHYAGVLHIACEQKLETAEPHQKLVDFVSQFKEPLSVTVSANLGQQSALMSLYK